MTAVDEPHTSQNSSRNSSRRSLLSGSKGLWLLIAAFIAVHVLWTWFGVYVQPDKFSDVDLYRQWVEIGLNTGVWPVLSTEWVYPIGALLPMVLASLAGLTFEAYALGWCAVVTIVNALALWSVLRMPGRNTRRGAWWWIAFLFLLGPIWMGRLDGIASAIMIIALTWALRRPWVAATLLTIGAWIKIVPGALLIPLFIAVKRRWSNVVLPAAVVTVAVIGVAVAFGSQGRVFGFLGAQSSRGLQVEAVAASPFLIARLFDGASLPLIFNTDILTVEIPTSAASTVASVLNILLILAVIACTYLIYRAVRSSGKNILEPLMWGSLALISALIIFNKVGSPQFEAWLAAPIVVRLASKSDRFIKSWWTAAIFVWLIAAMTQVVFPWNYDQLLIGETSIVLIETARNILIIAVFVMAIIRLVQLQARRKVRT